MRLVAPALLLLLAACGPVTQQQAERQCFERARLAQQPRGEVGVGASSDGGASARLRLNVSSDFLMGRDPSAVFDSCVFQKTGQPPTQPFYSRTDLKG
ncbi:hypothetical protein [Cereibacter changlensis]|uniref:Lipoprotein n=2 Tax=Cereibacter changlensis TaxID=402884 RepID=A0A2T4JT61_9RHOB|nr:hypothetical protein [Cereibacter changlensis]PTE21007.1 hypothetical protein C5F48_14435 [Cereibacter changlensis JA139]PZX52273.1 hypothetical protein LX76_02801 [Cereibacter changlensis]